MAKSAIGKAFASKAAPPEADESSPALEDSESEEPGADEAEVLAMKAFGKATSPEAKAAALKDFLRACGALGYEDEGLEEEPSMSGLGGLPAGF